MQWPEAPVQEPLWVPQGKLYPGWGLAAGQVQSALTALVLPYLSLCFHHLWSGLISGPPGGHF